MKVLKIVGGLLGFVVASVLGAGSMMSSEFRVERSIEIDAPPQRIFDQVNSLKKWDAWSPWLAKDPGIKNSFSGPDVGKGASVAWTSEESGNGTQTIVVSDAPSRIETELDFGDQGTSKADWTFAERGGGTKVTWGLTGDIPGPMGGIIARQMDDWVGADYEDGLARLKKHVESLPEPRPEPAAIAQAPTGPAEGAAEPTEGAPEPAAEGDAAEAAAEPVAEEPAAEQPAE